MMYAINDKGWNKMIKNMLLALSLASCVFSSAYARGSLDQITGGNPLSAEEPVEAGSQQDMQSSSDDLDNQAFATMTKKLMPLTPNQITILHADELKTKKAIESSPVTPPQPTSNTLLVNLSPGATPHRCAHRAARTGTGTAHRRRRPRSPPFDARAS